ncbi:MAG: class I SAM-dependent DNA methyltransferase, partial [Aquificota bacterium]
MANYWEELTKLVQNFSEETLKKVLEYKFGGLEATREKVRLYEYEDEHFEEIKKLLSVELNDGKLLLVYAIKTKGELSERSSKKRQFELAKKILGEVGRDAGLFVFYDEYGNFRFSLVYKVYKT